MRVPEHMLSCSLFQGAVSRVVYSVSDIVWLWQPRCWRKERAVFNPGTVGYGHRSRLMKAGLCEGQHFGPDALNSHMTQAMENVSTIAGRFTPSLFATA
jgi:hypothetical protein